MNNVLNDCDLNMLQRSKMVERIKISSGTKWEPIVGYSRVVKVDKIVHVSGTTATDSEGNLVAIADAQAQTTQVLLNIKRALESVGGTLEDVVRTRIYVTDISKWEEIGKVHGKFFKEIRPATSMIEVKRLVDPRMLVEIEAEAILK
jgi:enamine deaminase RidA (YjgF/YER057c/UK114 family)